MTTDPNCGVAHGDAGDRPADRVLVAVFASPVAAYLLRYGVDLGYRPVLLDPRPDAPTPDGLPARTRRVSGRTTGATSR